MPNKPSAKKDLRKSRKRAVSNDRIKTHVKALYKKSLELAKNQKKNESLEAATLFQQTVDKAVKRNIISKNRSTRLKSSLLKSVNAVA
ncbi:30S ribosomal protein S20 [Candidatus Uhrbacteria bacterium]|nr:30S ribosomal protein S20 [Candidatus Uhrbacteria bacterium]